MCTILIIVSDTFLRVMAAEYSKRMNECFLVHTHWRLTICTDDNVRSFPSNVGYSSNLLYSMDPITVRVKTINTSSGGGVGGCQKSFRG